MTATDVPPVSRAEGIRLDGVRVLVLFGGDRIFGSELGNLEVFRQMARVGLQARFITSSRWGHREIQPELERSGFEWTAAPFGYHWGRYLFGRHFYYLAFNLCGLIATNWRLWLEVWRWKPTHLYCMNWMFFTYAMPALLCLRLPLIYRAGDELPTHTAVHRWVVRQISFRVSRVVCISNFIQQCMVRAGFAAAQLRVIYNIPPARPLGLSLANLPEKGKGAVVLLYVGRLSKAKGLSVFIEAIDRLLRRGLNVVAWIVGRSGHDDEANNEFSRDANTRGIQRNIHFLGHIDDIYTVYCQSDIHVCPSLATEALSHVVLEAKQSGKPSVVFPTGGLPELIEHEVDGYICRDQTVEALIEGLEYFVKNSAARRAAGAAARQSLGKKFGTERFRDQWAKVFTETVSLHGRREVRFDGK